jgi:ABC-type branched-subunit amino acid transport system substrate-binding protein
MAYSGPNDLRLPVRLLLASALIAGVGAVSCQEAAVSGFPDAESPYVIGLLLPPGTPAGGAILAGVRAAVQAANGDGGRRVELALRGRAGAWGTDADAAARLVTEDGADALIGPPGAASSHLLLQVARKARRPVALLAPAGTVTGTGLRGGVARVVPGGREEARLVFASLAGGSTPGSRTWGLIVPAGRNGDACALDLAAAGDAAGGATEVLFRVGTGTPGPEAIQRRLQETDCSAIFLALPARAAGRLARALRAAGFRGTLAGPGQLLSAAFAAAAGPALEGFLTAAPTSAVASGSPLSLASDPAERMAFDAVRMLVDHLRRQVSDPQPFPREDHPAGHSGPLVFDARGNRLLPLSLTVIRAGRAEPLPPAPRRAVAGEPGDGRNM